MIFNFNNDDDNDEYYYFLKYDNIKLFQFFLTGNEEVIHLAGISSTCTSNRNHRFTIGGKIFAQAEVKRESVWEVISDSKVEINNDKDKSCR